MKKTINWNKIEKLIFKISEESYEFGKQTFWVGDKFDQSLLEKIKDEVTRLNQIK